jgi:hypothetical protein
MGLSTSYLARDHSPPILMSSRANAGDAPLSMVEVGSRPRHPLPSRESFHAGVSQHQDVADRQSKKRELPRIST